MQAVTEEGLTWRNDEVTRWTRTWQRQVVVDWNGHKVRLTISRDSYDFQSRIYSEVFSHRNREWHRIELRSGREYGFLPSASEKDDIAIIVATNPVINSLIAYAQMILEGVPA